MSENKSLSEQDRARLIVAWRRSALDVLLSNYPECCASDMDCYDPAPPLWREFLANRAMAPLIEASICERVERHGRTWWKLLDRSKARAMRAEIVEASL